LICDRIVIPRSESAKNSKYNDKAKGEKAIVILAPGDCKLTVTYFNNVSDTYAENKYR
jgi:hypothetical protein